MNVGPILFRWVSCLPLLAVLPAPSLYGKVFDSTCILKRTASCTDSEGSCLLYDRQSLRLNYHGLAIGLKSISTILFCVTYFLARRKLSLLTAQQTMRQTGLKELKLLNTQETETSYLWFRTVVLNLCNIATHLQQLNVKETHLNEIQGNPFCH